MLVIADDFSGAAECAGAGWRYGLDAELHTAPLVETGNFTVLDTNTRLLPSDTAAGRFCRLIAKCRMPAGDVFKKTDSVLRGAVRAELQGLTIMTGCNRVLLVPANPEFGRTIDDGLLLVDGIPLDQTEFAHDPHHPAKSADVCKLIGQDTSFPVSVISPNAPMPDKGIIIGNVRTPDDLHIWAGRVRETDILPAGSSAFLAAILENRGYAKRMQASGLTTTSYGRTLICSGSASASSRVNIGQAETCGIPVCRIPTASPNTDSQIEYPAAEWRHTVINAFIASSCVIVCIGQSAMGTPRGLEQCLAELVEGLLAELPVDRLLLEGGATAAAVLQRLGSHQFRVLGECAPGIVNLHTSNISAVITIKPGSYPWLGPFSLAISPQLASSGS